MVKAPLGGFGGLSQEEEKYPLRDLGGFGGLSQEDDKFPIAEFVVRGKKWKASPV